MIGSDKRKKYLVNKRLQLQFAWLLATQAAVPIIILGGSLYIVNKMYLYTLQRLVGMSAMSDADIQSVLEFSMRSMGALLIITTILLVFIGIRFSHHIAGPLYKIEMLLEELLEGKKVEPLHFRDTDAVDELAEKINGVVKKFGQAI